MSDIKQKMVAAVDAALKSDDFKASLNKIHRHYPNSKAEIRYRDALLEALNDEADRTDSGLRAYSEVENVDLVVTSRDNPCVTQHLRIELKFHFTFDLAVRVANKLDGIDEWLSAIPDHSSHDPREWKGDLRAILRDCLTKKGSVNNRRGCDLFILIVQDRRGDLFDYQQGTDASCPRHALLNDRGIPIHFLKEQKHLSEKYPDEEKYRAAWMAPIRRMQTVVAGKRSYVPMKYEPICVQNAHGISLTTHIFGFDFS